ncbi:MAG: hypothetical protein K2G23_01975 [Muribaculaceae bacterium]|nr:hypothetical protein [Muribaculaceae bacterium]
MKSRLLVSVLFCGCVALAVPAQDLHSYSFDLSRGSFPAGTETFNLNGLLPDVNAYKHGYVTTGWTVDRLDSRGYVALSPTYTGKDEDCENMLSLPECTIDEDAVLSWEARSVYRHFPESYRAVAYIVDPEGGEEPVTLLEVSEESYGWKRHTVSLRSLSGKKVRIGFVATSRAGYMLALSDIRVGNDVESEGEIGSSSPSPENSDGFTRALVVDKATGMWCVNCPEGDVAIESLMERFGNRLILLNTHVRDVLANEAYWDSLKWYSVPRMMLNRIKATEGPNTKKFSDYYDQPTPFGISFDSPVVAEDGMIKVTAEVRVSEPVDNSDGQYRVGYVLTGNFHEADNARYNQKNNCTQPSYGAFYYLPSEIPSALMYYDDVTLTSETAFSGIEGSLPALMTPGETYKVVLEIENPSLHEALSESHITAFVMDAVSGELMNAVSEVHSGDAGIRGMNDSFSRPMLSVDKEGRVRTDLAPEDHYAIEVFTPEGSRVMTRRGMAAGNDSFLLPPVSGILIVRLSSPRGCRILKVSRSL